MIGVDTNLLVYAHRAGAPEHEAARLALERAASGRDGWGISVATISEFWRTVTGSGFGPQPSTEEEAAIFIRALTDEAGAEVWQPGPGFGGRLLQLAVEKRVRGSHIYDLQIALASFDNGATELWTHDRGFTTVPGLRVRYPLSPPG